MNLKDKFAKAIRILTTAPVFALLLCTLLYFLMDGAFASLRHYLMAVFFLSILPVLAYPVSAIIPPLRRKGRDGQRNLAIVFSVVGYVGGFLYALLGGGTGFEKSALRHLSDLRHLTGDLHLYALQGKRSRLRLLRPRRDAVRFCVPMVPVRLSAADAGHLVEREAQAAHGLAASGWFRHSGSGHADLPRAISVIL